MTEPTNYYVPKESHWPAVGSLGLGLLVIGCVQLLHNKVSGKYFFLAGSCTMAYMLYGWFSAVIAESQQGLYSKQMDRSFRWGMLWFIFSEIMFFAAFFGALFYVREFSVPWLGGAGAKGSTHLLWNNFQATWPLLNNPDPTKFHSTLNAVYPWGLPAINTLLLLTSGVTLTCAHHAIKKDSRKILLLGLLATIILGITFLILQAIEYHHAYTELALQLNSGIYGSTFFMLTGFHGAHVTIGTIMLTIIFCRSFKKHFTKDKHFAFEAVAWYWHFVDVVWLLLFILVYWL